MLWLPATSCSCAWNRANDAEWTVAADAAGTLPTAPQQAGFFRLSRGFDLYSELMAQEAAFSQFPLPGATRRLAARSCPDALIGLGPEIHSENLPINTPRSGSLFSSHSPTLLLLFPGIAFQFNTAAQKPYLTASDEHGDVEIARQRTPPGKSGPKVYVLPSPSMRSKNKQQKQNKQIPTTIKSSNICYVVYRGRVLIV